MVIRHYAIYGGMLSNVLRKELKMSSALIGKIKRSDAVMVNGVPRYMNHVVVPQDLIEIALEDAEHEYPAEHTELRILYEDDYLVAFDKPAGMLVHPTRSRFTGTLANYALGYYESNNQNCGFHPVSRLDRDTFGIVLVAKNSYVHSLMHSEHLEGRISKTYEAIVYGIPSASNGVVDAPVARKGAPSLLREVREDGQHAVSEYVVIDSCNNVSHLMLNPVTGRTHQLRVHCMHAGFPIIGDPHYNSFESQKFSNHLGVKTQLLCAKKLEFVHPISGERVIVESGYSLDIKDYI